MSRLPSVRVALVQDAAVAFDLRESLLKAESLIASAASASAQLIVFPEAFLSGYPKGADFGVRIGQRSVAGRNWFARYFASAVDLADNSLDQLRQVIRKHQVHVVMGIVERLKSTLYCSAVTMNAQGDIIGLRRKLVPTALERVIWGQGDGSTLSVTPSALGNIGVAICWENYMPLLRTTLYQGGVELYCAPTVDDRPTWKSTMQHIALEGRCFVLSACQYARLSDFPADYSELIQSVPNSCHASVAPSASISSSPPSPSLENSPGNTSNPTLIRGGSCLVGPLGEFLIEPTFDRSTILYADCHLGEIARARFDFDAVGHYSRPDIFHLSVNRQSHWAEHNGLPEVPARESPPG